MKKNLYYVYYVWLINRKINIYYGYFRWFISEKIISTMSGFFCQLNQNVTWNCLWIYSNCTQIVRELYLRTICVQKMYNLSKCPNNFMSSFGLIDKIFLYYGYYVLLLNRKTIIYYGYFGLLISEKIISTMSTMFG